MAGPWKHPDSGIWYYRKATPSDLKNNQDQLVALGVVYKREIHRSLDTRDKAKADQRYALVKLEIEAMWNMWRSLLAEGPTNLTHKQRVALAGKDAVNLLAGLEENPDKVFLPPHFIPNLLSTKIEKNEFPSFVDRVDLYLLEKELRGLDLLTLLDRLHEILKSDADQHIHVFVAFVLEAIFTIDTIRSWERSGEIANKEGVSLSTPSSYALADQVITYRARVFETLRDRLDGDYSEPRWASSLPKFERTAFSTVQVSQPAQAAVTFTSIIDKREADSKSRLITSVSPATIRKYRTNCSQLAKFRGRDTAGDLTRDDGEGWKKSLLPKNSNKTVRDKITGIKAVLQWGQDQSGGTLYDDSKPPWKYVELPPKPIDDGASKAHSLENARLILEAAREETKPHLRWIPWLLAYTGMRIGEIAQLERKDVFEVDGRWFLHVRVGSGRTTKTNKPRKIPIHQDVATEGLIEFRDGCPEGPLFTENRVPGDLQAWIGKQIDPSATEHVAPNHGFRHLWEDLATASKLDFHLKLLITGRSSGTSVDMYQSGDSKLLAMAEEMDKFPSFLPTS